VWKYIVPPFGTLAVCCALQKRIKKWHPCRSSRTANRLSGRRTMRTFYERWSAVWPDPSFHTASASVLWMMCWKVRLGAGGEEVPFTSLTWRGWVWWVQFWEGGLKETYPWWRTQCWNSKRTREFWAQLHHILPPTRRGDASRGETRPSSLSYVTLKSPRRWQWKCRSSFIREIL